MATCAGKTRKGSACTANSIPGQQWCYHHHPAYAEERKQSASHAATSKYSSVAKELRELRELIWELLDVLLSDNLPLRVRRELQNVVQLLQCYLRAAELEMRAAAEPLKGDLDVASLKAQVLERIEALEEQERERQKLLTDVLTMAEEHGLDAGALKAVMGG